MQDRAAGLCHSDLSVINGDRPRPMPMVLGHEAAGIVEESARASRPRAGDHVVLRLRAELRPLPALPRRPACPVRAGCGGQRRRHAAVGRAPPDRPDGKPVNHHLGVSGFRRVRQVSRSSLVKIDPELPLDVAALFGCAVVTGVGAVVNTAKIQRRRLGGGHRPGRRRPERR